MNIALRKTWTQEAFFAWAENQDIRYEFNGLQPVAMTGGFNGASVIGVNLITVLRTKLRGSPCRPLGPDAGLETVNGAIRYPDALVTCSRVEMNKKTVPGVVIVFEVVGATPDSIHRDHFQKVKEYAAVPSIRRYVILESAAAGLTVMERKDAGDPWTVTILSKEDILSMPEIGIEMPVAAFYEDVTFPEQQV